MADERRAEIEAVGPFADHALLLRVGREEWARRVIAALDRVRDTRGDDDRPQDTRVWTIQGDPPKVSDGPPIQSGWAIRVVPEAVAARLDDERVALALEVGELRAKLKRAEAARSPQDEDCPACGQPKADHVGPPAPPLTRGVLGATEDRPGSCLTKRGVFVHRARSPQTGDREEDRDADAR